MFKNFLSYCESKKDNVFNYLPLTFVLEIDSQSYAYELDKFIQYFSFVEKIIENTGLSEVEMQNDEESLR